MSLRFFGIGRTNRICIALIILTTFLVNMWFGMYYNGQFEFGGLAELVETGGNINRVINGIVSRNDPGLKIAMKHEKAVQPCPYWCYGLPSNVTSTEGLVTGNTGKTPGPHFLTAVISVRIYDWKDLAKLGTRELIQWLQYLSYAGVEHVYLYDAYAFKNESQEVGLREYITSGYLTYTDWHHHAVPFSLSGTQAAAYGDCIQRWGNLSAWQLGVDMDEYPFRPADRKPGFLARYLREFDALSPDADQISELSMQNYLYLGKPMDVTKHPLLIGRIWRRTKNPHNHLVKPVYRPASIYWPDIHHNSLKYGRSKTVSETELRMNHYWGARLQNWGEDTQKVLDMTVEDRSMEPIVANLYKCGSCRPL